MKEIGDWLDETYLNFAEQENKDPRRSANEFLQRLTERRTNFQAHQFLAWTPARINTVKMVNKKIS